MIQEPIRNKPASVRAKLHNIARKENIELNSLIILYMQERILYRLSQSCYRDNFVLKGGLLLFAHNFFKGRPTQDMDFLGKQISNDINNIHKVFKEIFTQKHIDGLIFSTDTMTIENITEDAKYFGVRVKIRCLLGNAVNIICIDIGFGDVVIPNPIDMDFPCILESEPTPNIRVYTIDSVVSEKFHAMISRGIMNSRMKDFCDIYMLSKANDFVGTVLMEALRETFERRNTKFQSNPIVFSESFKEDRDKKLQWNAFIRKTKMSEVLPTFEEVLIQIKNFILPLYEKMGGSSNFVKFWIHEANSWN